MNLKVRSFSLSYTKTNKLISALYMVTDIMDRDEPLRNKLRNSGACIVSDIYSFDKGQDIFNQINIRISEILSFIEIAVSVNIISDMNANILIKEFKELKDSVMEVTPKNDKNWLEEFMKEDENLETKVLNGGVVSIGQTGLSAQAGTRIGVQKASTLLKALSDKIPDLRTSRITIQRNFTGSHSEVKHENHLNDILKNKRREEVVSVIKDKLKDNVNLSGLTITDIKSNGHEMLTSCSEKTLQRELVSMVLDGVLKKTGEKRWSRYSIAHN
ncbi:MAG: hypothetical protein WCG45_00645 [bacterium]